MAETVLGTMPGRWRSFYDNIAAVLHNRADLVVTPESIRSVMVIIKAAQQSATHHQAIRLDG
ncbi:hypothetical protein NKDENANG_04086 [Candidatus Entotheonellaceae bacterium PAL068K]